jgi:hypothetical protein
MMFRFDALWNHLSVKASWPREYRVALINEASRFVTQEIDGEPTASVWEDFAAGANRGWSEGSCCDYKLMSLRIACR